MQQLFLLIDNKYMFILLILGLTVEFKSVRTQKHMQIIKGLEEILWRMPIVFLLLSSVLRCR